MAVLTAIIYTFSAKRVI